MLTFPGVPLAPEPGVQGDSVENGQEEGESMDAVDQDDEAMMAAMGISGFGSTKVWVFSMWTHDSIRTTFVGEARRREPRRRRKD